jgi:hypothetical protein
MVLAILSYRSRPSRDLQSRTRLSITGLSTRGRLSTGTLHLAYSNGLCSLDDERGFVVDEVTFAILYASVILPHRVF